MVKEMKVKKKVIMESIKRVSERIEELEHIKDANPTPELFNIRREIKQLLEDNKEMNAKSRRNRPTPGNATSA